MNNTTANQTIEELSKQRETLLAACEAALSCSEIYGTVLAGMLVKAVKSVGGNPNPLGTERLPEERFEDFEQRITR